MTAIPGKRLLPALVAVAAALICAATPAAGAQPAPLGHPCTAQNGVRFCPAYDLSTRVPSWNGVPLDVDVTLPPSGDGPFPTILLLHGSRATATRW